MSHTTPREHTLIRRECCLSIVRLRANFVSKKGGGKRAIDDDHRRLCRCAVLRQRPHHELADDVLRAAQAEQEMQLGECGFRRQVKAR